MLVRLGAHNDNFAFYKYAFSNTQHTPQSAHC